MNNKSNRFQELDALRGLAALMVVFFHFTLGRAEANIGFKLGTTGVDLFFIISGFVIFMSISKVKSSRDFVINRISRLYPTYWACVTFTFLLISIINLSNHNNIPIFKYIGNMTMFQYYLKISDLDGPYWTMIIEMIFYIFILLLFHFKILRYFNLLGILLSITLVVSTYFLNNNLVQKLFIAIPFFQFVPLFIAGSIFYKIYTEKKRLFENYILIITCLICQIVLFKFSGRSSMFINHVEYSSMLILYFFIFTLFVSGNLKFIVSRPSLFLGKISFALYLIHQYVSINIIIPTLINKWNVNFWIASFLITLPIVIGIASLVTYYIEVPLSKKMKEKLKKVIWN